MRKTKPQRRATTFQIVGTFLVVISAFILVAYVFVSQVKEDMLKYQQGGREYTVIAARKIPEYTQLSGEQGAYQAVYEAGIRGGYNNRSIGRVDHINVSYGAVNISTAVWMDERVDKSIPTAVQNIILKIPEDKTIEGNLTEVIRNATLEYLRIRAPESGMDLGPYENATFMVNRSECVSAEYAGMGKGCFNITIIPTNYTQKNYTSSGSLMSATTVTSTTNTHMEIRLFKMYELMRSFIRNNFLVRTGSNVLNYNLLATQLEADTACPAGSNCDWDVRSRTTVYCPGSNNCDYSANGLDARLDYSCAPKLYSPACNATIKNNMRTKIQEIEAELNRDTMLFPYVVLCPASAPKCETEYYGGLSLQTDPKNGKNYQKDRFSWKIGPASPKTWDDVILWDGTSDDYNVLWWQQTPTGRCTLPDGYIFKEDTQPAADSVVSAQTGSAKDNWVKDSGFPSYTQYFPEGTACADAYYVDCHEIREYWQNVGTCSPSSCDGCSGSGGHSGNTDPAWCEVNSYSGDYAHTNCGAGPYGGVWCDAATSTEHYAQGQTCSYSCSCPWTTCTCTCGYTTCPTRSVARQYTGNVAYTHCDVRYDFSGHFKYRARLDPLTITLTDESRTIPVIDTDGQKKTAKPQLKAIYKGTVYEKTQDNDRCVDREGDEDKTGSRDYHAGDATAGDECPKAKNPAAPKMDYYGSTPC